MKKSIVLFLFIFSQVVFSQFDGLDITLSKAGYSPNAWGRIQEYGPDGAEKDKLAALILYLKIDGFSENLPIDFNLFSLVENHHKLRHRPLEVFFNGYNLIRINIDSIPNNDPFLFYSKTGIENYDIYNVEKPDIFTKRTNTRQRFCLLHLPVKKNKKKIFQLTIPVKIRKEGEFSLYYRDKLIKTFIATNKWTKF